MTKLNFGKLNYVSNKVYTKNSMWGVLEDVALLIAVLIHIGILSHFLFFSFSFFFNFIFPLYSKGIKLSLHVYITITFFPPPFVLLQHEYLDIVLNATQ